MIEDSELFASGHSWFVIGFPKCFHFAVIKDLLVVSYYDFALRCDKEILRLLVFLGRTDMNMFNSCDESLKVDSANELRDSEGRPWVLVVCCLRLEQPVVPSASSVRPDKLKLNKAGQLVWMLGAVRLHGP